jgi:hypothetical protein
LSTNTKGYLTGVTQQFIALQSNQGICETVPRPLTGTYLISNDGYFEGTVGFLYSHSLIRVQFNNLIVDLTGYQMNFEALGTSLESWVNDISVNQNLAWNLLLIMEQRNSINLNGFSQTVSYSATPSAVFSTEAVYAAMSSRDQGTCPAVAFPTFYRKDALLAATFDRSLLDTHCNTTFPAILSYVPSQNNTVGASINIDMNSFATAASVNMGYSSLENLEEVLFPELLLSFSVFTYPPTGESYVVKQFINPVHADMDTLYCLFEAAQHTFVACFVRLSWTFFLPVLNHVGGSNANTYGIPHFCNWYGVSGHYVQ